MAGASARLKRRTEVVVEGAAERAQHAALLQGDRVAVYGGRDPQISPIRIPFDTLTHAGRHACS